MQLYFSTYLPIPNCYFKTAEKIFIGTCKISIKTLEKTEGRKFPVASEGSFLPNEETQELNVHVKSKYTVPFAKKKEKKNNDQKSAQKTIDLLDHWLPSATYTESCSNGASDHLSLWNFLARESNSSTEKTHFSLFPSSTPFPPFDLRLSDVQIWPSKRSQRASNSTATNDVEETATIERMKDVTRCITTLLH